MSTNTLTKQEKKTMNQIFWRSGFIFASFNMVKMMGQGWGFAMIPAINEVYKDDEEARKKALLRNTEFFNCHACMLGFIMGLAYAMEKERASNPEAIEENTITSVKTALMGPLAGIGDSLFFNTIRIIAAGIGISLCAQGNILGSFIFILIYGGSFLVLKYVLIQTGYNMGANFIETAFKSGVINMITKAAATVGLIMVGAMVASMVNVNIALTLNMSGAELSLQSILDSIMPGLLSLVLIYFVVKLLRKGQKPAMIVLYLLIGCIALAAIGVF